MTEQAVGDTPGLMLQQLVNRVVKKNTARAYKAKPTKYPSTEVKLCTQLPGSTASVDVFDGVIGVLTEVPAKKISSEEETWSGKSLMIFYNNWLGAYSQLAPFARMVRSALGVRHRARACWCELACSSRGAAAVLVRGHAAAQPARAGARI